jgi:hypothetical protein
VTVDDGVGDEIRWPYAVSLILTGPGQYRLTAPIPVQVRLPDGAQLVQGLRS